MKFPRLETVRLLKPRLGFGSAEACMEEVGGPEAPAIPEVTLDAVTEQTEESVKVGESLSHLSQHLSKSEELEVPQPKLVETLVEEVKESEPEPPQKVGLLEGYRVGAIGFGRQDIAGLAAAMIAERGRIEFLPRGEVKDNREFDLFLLNCASAEMLKRDASSFRAILASGTPTIAIGSRSALGVLRTAGDPRTWDFAAKPLSMDELVWRAANLLARREEMETPKKLPARVVVADHDPFTRTLIESALLRQGVACELVEDGEAAWSAIGKSQPGAVILDLTLPNRDGFQLMADIRRAPGRKPKVIVLSARQSEADILRAFALGADDYVTKPFSPLELSARLTRLLGGAPEHV